VYDKNAQFISWQKCDLAKKLIALGDEWSRFAKYPTQNIRRSATKLNLNGGFL
jgi:hypothetical protein